MKTSTNPHRIGVTEFIFYLLGMIILLLLAALITEGQTQTLRAVAVYPQNQQQPYREYRGVRLGMTTVEVRAKLGEPAMKSDEQDFYVLSANETAQIGYDTGKKASTISIDYTGGVGAPDYKTVVGEGMLLQRPDGSLFRMVFYDSEGFWVSYNKSSSNVSVVTVTIGTIRN